MSDVIKKDLVLVVDDDPDSLGMINDTLDQAGLTVLVALEGNQAISIANSITPDIILMDALMPGMNGFETCEKIKEISHLSHIPIIFMTGLSDTESVVRGLEAGGVDYIQKPVNSGELIARMRVHLDNARLTQSARTALDQTGQYLLTITTQGHFKWATPQAHQLFASSGLTQDWLLTDLGNITKPFLSPGFNKEKAVAIHAGSKKLALYLVNKHENNELLLRLVNLDRPSEITVLQEAFDLTAREAEVLKWIAMGKSNAEIAIILDISPRTINTHLVQIFRKLGVENRTSAAIIAHKRLEQNAYV